MARTAPHAMGDAWRYGILFETLRRLMSIPPKTRNAIPRANQMLRLSAKFAPAATKNNRAISNMRPPGNHHILCMTHTFLLEMCATVSSLCPDR
jgi:hypothetical protein